MSTLDTRPSPDPTDPIDTDASEERRRRSTLLLIGGFLTALMLLVVIGWVVDSPSDSDAELTGSFSSLDGGTIDLDELRGQPTVVNFFASWCGPCRAEMPDLERVHQRFAGQVAFVGLNAGETDVDAARELIAQTGVSYPIGFGGDEFIEAVGGLGMPVTALFDADGNLVETHTGLLTADALTAKIEAIG